MPLNESFHSFRLDLCKNVSNGINTPNDSIQITKKISIWCEANHLSAHTKMLQNRPSSMYIECAVEMFYI
jgi:hypothetical protein